MKLGNVLGRRHSILWGCSIMIIGAVLQCSAHALAHSIVGRIITGIGNSFNTSTVPVWQSKCSKPHHRGLAVVFEGRIVVVGIATSQWLDLGMSFTGPSAAAWRFPIAFQLIFAISVLVGVYYMPESPRWLILKERDDQAVTILSAIYDVDRGDHLVMEEIQAMRISVRESAASIPDVFRMGPKRNFHRAVLGYLTQVFQQIGGINIIIYYAAAIYLNQMGLSPLVSRIIAAAGGTWCNGRSWKWWIAL
ncbi:uncharacterized protein Z519_11561 [Cladophialophora bantiana CBS 173.52]|uniref:Major facilitator superfamily (MFS) profile domain-containing protein n=1 Tax=Cladophialophora bantiana (strain ATCC 10958 / CBS 173.52 / CDC B-1940 / NIH 8579) TaxID=1442370 RepID=A0A0D2ECX6_CLAB1|nr:uncharacterized protein Z519_11561 [Cladophialophora bantiana CBS 173.52]KIW87976.1 hypothetical protein Z519_11561 [Cladophialophora bantiana CBS 173.52]